MISVLFDNDAQMQGQILNRYGIFSDQFKDTISVLLDNDAQMEVRYIRKILKNSDVYKHRVSVLRVNAARIDKTGPPRPGESFLIFNLCDPKVRDYKIKVYYRCVYLPCRPSHYNTLKCCSYEIY